MNLNIHNYNNRIRADYGAYGSAGSDAAGCKAAGCQAAGSVDSSISQAYVNPQTIINKSNFDQYILTPVGERFRAYAKTVPSLREIYNALEAKGWSISKLNKDDSQKTIIREFNKFHVAGFKNFKIDTTSAADLKYLQLLLDSDSQVCNDFLNKLYSNDINLYNIFTIPFKRNVESLANFDTEALKLLANSLGAYINTGKAPKTEYIPVKRLSDRVLIKDIGSGSEKITEKNYHQFLNHKQIGGWSCLGFKSSMILVYEAFFGRIRINEKTGEWIFPNDEKVGNSEDNEALIKNYDRHYAYYTTLMPEEMSALKALFGSVPNSFIVSGFKDLNEIKDPKQRELWLKIFTRHVSAYFRFETNTAADKRELVTDRPFGIITEENIETYLHNRIGKSFGRFASLAALQPYLEDKQLRPYENITIKQDLFSGKEIALLYKILLQLKANGGKFSELNSEDKTLYLDFFNRYHTNYFRYPVYLSANEFHHFYEIMCTSYGKKLFNMIETSDIFSPVVSAFSNCGFNIEEFIQKDKEYADLFIILANHFFDSGFKNIDIDTAALAQLTINRLKWEKKKEGTRLDKIAHKADIPFKSVQVTTGEFRIINEENIGEYINSQVTGRALLLLLKEENFFLWEKIAQTDKYTVNEGTFFSNDNAKNDFTLASLKLTPQEKETLLRLLNYFHVCACRYKIYVSYSNFDAVVNSEPGKEYFKAFQNQLKNSSLYSPVYRKFEESGWEITKLAEKNKEYADLLIFCLNQYFDTGFKSIHIAYLRPALKKRLVWEKRAIEALDKLAELREDTLKEQKESTPSARMPAMEHISIISFGEESRFENIRLESIESLEEYVKQILRDQHKAGRKCKNIEEILKKKESIFGCLKVFNTPQVVMDIEFDIIDKNNIRSYIQHRQIGASFVKFLKSKNLHLLAQALLQGCDNSDQDQRYYIELLIPLFNEFHAQNFRYPCYLTIGGMNIQKYIADPNYQVNERPRFDIISQLLNPDCVLGALSEKEVSRFYRILFSEQGTYFLTKAASLPKFYHLIKIFEDYKFNISTLKEKDEDAFRLLLFLLNMFFASGCKDIKIPEEVASSIEPAVMGIQIKTFNRYLTAQKARQAKEKEIASKTPSLTMLKDWWGFFTESLQEKWAKEYLSLATGSENPADIAFDEVKKFIDGAYKRAEIRTQMNYISAALFAIGGYDLVLSNEQGDAIMLPMMRGTSRDLVIFDRSELYKQGYDTEKYVMAIDKNTNKIYHFERAQLIEQGKKLENLFTKGLHLLDAVGEEIQEFKASIARYMNLSGAVMEANENYRKKYGQEAEILFDLTRLALTPQGTELPQITEDPKLKFKSDLFRIICHYVLKEEVKIQSGEIMIAPNLMLDLKPLGVTITDGKPDMAALKEAILKAKKFVFYDVSSRKEIAVNAENPAIDAKIKAQTANALASIESKIENNKRYLASVVDTWDLRVNEAGGAEAVVGDLLGGTVYGLIIEPRLMHIQCFANPFIIWSFLIHTYTNPMAFLRERWEILKEGKFGRIARDISFNATIVYDLSGKGLKFAQRVARPVYMVSRIAFIVAKNCIYAKLYDKSGKVIETITDPLILRQIINGVSDERLLPSRMVIEKAEDDMIGVNNGTIILNPREREKGNKAQKNQNPKTPPATQPALVLQPATAETTGAPPAGRIPALPHETRPETRKAPEKPEPLRMDKMPGGSGSNEAKNKAIECYNFCISFMQGYHTERLAKIEYNTFLLNIAELDMGSKIDLLPKLLHLLELMPANILEGSFDTILNIVKDVPNDISRITDDGKRTELKLALGQKLNDIYLALITKSPLLSDKGAAWKSLMRFIEECPGDVFRNIFVEKNPNFLKVYLKSFIEAQIRAIEPPREATFESLSKYLEDCKNLDAQIKVLFNAKNIKNLPEDQKQIFHEFEKELTVKYKILLGEIRKLSVSLPEAREKTDELLICFFENCPEEILKKLPDEKISPALDDMAKIFIFDEFNSTKLPEEINMTLIGSCKYKYDKLHYYISKMLEMENLNGETKTKLLKYRKQLINALYPELLNKIAAFIEKAPDKETRSARKSLFDEVYKKSPLEARQVYNKISPENRIAEDSPEADDLKTLQHDIRGEWLITSCQYAEDFLKTRAASGNFKWLYYDLVHMLLETENMFEIGAADKSKLTVSLKRLVEKAEALILLIDKILRGYGLLSAKETEQLEMIRTNLENLKKLSLLNATTIQFDKKVTPIKDFVNNLVKNEYSDIAGVKIKFESKDNTQNCELFANQRFLRFVFKNLIDNAIREFKKEPGKEHIITISVETYEGSQKIKKIIVKDTGPGIPEAKRDEKGNILINTPEINKESIWLKGKTGNKEKGGTGFGLWRIKQFVNIYGWEISECGVYGIGARFEIELSPDAREKVKTALQPDTKKINPPDRFFKPPTKKDPAPQPAASPKQPPVEVQKRPEPRAEEKPVKDKDVAIQEELVKELNDYKYSTGGRYVAYIQECCRRLREISVLISAETNKLKPDELRKEAFLSLRKQLVTAHFKEIIDKINNETDVAARKKLLSALTLDVVKILYTALDPKQDADTIRQLNLIRAELEEIYGGNKGAPPRGGGKPGLLQRAADTLADFVDFVRRSFVPQPLPEAGDYLIAFAERTKGKTPAEPQTKAPGKPGDKIPPKEKLKKADDDLRAKEPVKSENNLSDLSGRVKTVATAFKQFKQKLESENLGNEEKLRSIERFCQDNKIDDAILEINKQIAKYPEKLTPELEKLCDQMRELINSIQDFHRKSGNENDILFPTVPETARVKINAKIPAYMANKLRKMGVVIIVNNSQWDATAYFHPLRMIFIQESKLDGSGIFHEIMHAVDEILFTLQSTKEGSEFANFYRGLIDVLNNKQNSSYVSTLKTRISYEIKLENIPAEAASSEALACIFEDYCSGKLTKENGADVYPVIEEIAVFLFGEKIKTEAAKNRENRKAAEEKARKDNPALSRTPNVEDDLKYLASVTENLDILAGERKTGKQNQPYGLRPADIPLCYLKDCNKTFKIIREWLDNKDVELADENRKILEQYENQFLNERYPYILNRLTDAINTGIIKDAADLDCLCKAIDNMPPQVREKYSDKIGALKVAIEKEEKTVQESDVVKTLTIPAVPKNIPTMEFLTAVVKAEGNREIIANAFGTTLIHRNTVNIWLKDFINHPETLKNLDELAKKLNTTPVKLILFCDNQYFRHTLLRLVHSPDPVSYLRSAKNIPFYGYFLKLMRASGIKLRAGEEPTPEQINKAVDILKPLKETAYKPVRGEKLSTEEVVAAVIMDPKHSRDNAAKELEKKLKEKNPEATLTAESVIQRINNFVDKSPSAVIIDCAEDVSAILNRSITAGEIILVCCRKNYIRAIKALAELIKNSPAAMDAAAVETILARHKLRAEDLHAFILKAKECGVDLKTFGLSDENAVKTTGILPKVISAFNLRNLSNALGENEKLGLDDSADYNSSNNLIGIDLVILRYGLEKNLEFSASLKKIQADESLRKAFKDKYGFEPQTILDLLQRSTWQKRLGFLSAVISEKIEVEDKEDLAKAAQRFNLNEDEAGKILKDFEKLKDAERDFLNKKLEKEVHSEQPTKSPAPKEAARQIPLSDGGIILPLRSGGRITFSRNEMALFVFLEKMLPAEDNLLPRERESVQRIQEKRAKLKDIINRNNIKSDEFLRKIECLRQDTNLINSIKCFGDYKFNNLFAVLNGISKLLTGTDTGTTQKMRPDDNGRIEIRPVGEIPYDPTDRNPNPPARLHEEASKDAEIKGKKTALPPLSDAEISVLCRLNGVTSEEMLKIIIDTVNRACGTQIKTNAFLDKIAETVYLLYKNADSTEREAFAQNHNFTTFDQLFTTVKKLTGKNLEYPPEVREKAAVNIPPYKDTAAVVTYLRPGGIRSYIIITKSDCAFLYAYYIEASQSFKNICARFGKNEETAARYLISLKGRLNELPDNYLKIIADESGINLETLKTHLKKPTTTGVHRSTGKSPIPWFTDSIKNILLFYKNNKRDATIKEIARNSKKSLYEAEKEFSNILQRCRRLDVPQREYLQTELGIEKKEDLDYFLGINKPVNLRMTEDPKYKDQTKATRKPDENPADDPAGNKENPQGKLIPGPVGSEIPATRAKASGEGNIPEPPPDTHEFGRTNPPGMSHLPPEIRSGGGTTPNPLGLFVPLFGSLIGHKGKQFFITLLKKDISASDFYNIAILHRVKDPKELIIKIMEAKETEKDKTAKELGITRNELNKCLEKWLGLAENILLKFPEKAENLKKFLDSANQLRHQIRSMLLKSDADISTILEVTGSEFKLKDLSSFSAQDANALTRLVNEFNKLSPQIRESLRGMQAEYLYSTKDFQETLSAKQKKINEIIFGNFRREERLLMIQIIEKLPPQLVEQLKNNGWLFISVDNLKGQFATRVSGMCDPGKKIIIIDLDELVRESDPVNVIIHEICHTLFFAEKISENTQKLIEFIREKEYLYKNDAARGMTKEEACQDLFTMLLSYFIQYYDPKSDKESIEKIKAFLSDGALFNNDPVKLKDLDIIINYLKEIHTELGGEKPAPAGGETEPAKTKLEGAEQDLAEKPSPVENILLKFPEKASRLSQFRAAAANIYSQIRLTMSINNVDFYDVLEVKDRKLVIKNDSLIERSGEKTELSNLVRQFNEYNAESKKLLTELQADYLESTKDFHDSLSAERQKINKLIFGNFTREERLKIIEIIEKLPPYLIELMANEEWLVAADKDIKESIIPAAGSCNQFNRTIFIVNDGKHLTNTMFHEIGHAILYIRGAASLTAKIDSAKKFIIETFKLSSSAAKEKSMHEKFARAFAVFMRCKDMTEEALINNLLKEFKKEHFTPDDAKKLLAHLKALYNELTNASSAPAQNIPDKPNINLSVSPDKKMGKAAVPLFPPTESLRGWGNLMLELASKPSFEKDFPATYWNIGDFKKRESGLPSEEKNEIQENILKTYEKEKKWETIKTPVPVFDKQNWEKLLIASRDKNFSKNHPETCIYLEAFEDSIKKCEAAGLTRDSLKALIMQLREAEENFKISDPEKFEMIKLKITIEIIKDFQLTAQNFILKYEKMPLSTNITDRIKLFNTAYDMATMAYDLYKVMDRKKFEHLYALMEIDKSKVFNGQLERLNNASRDIYKELRETGAIKDCPEDILALFRGKIPSISILQKNINAMKLLPPKLISDMRERCAVITFYPLNKKLMENGGTPKEYGYAEAQRAYVGNADYTTNYHETGHIIMHILDIGYLEKNEPKFSEWMNEFEQLFSNRQKARDFAIKTDVKGERTSTYLDHVEAEIMGEPFSGLIISKNRDCGKFTPINEFFADCFKLYYFAKFNNKYKRLCELDPKMTMLFEIFDKIWRGEAPDYSKYRKLNGADKPAPAGRISIEPIDKAKTAAGNIMKKYGVNELNGPSFVLSQNHSGVADFAVSLREYLLHKFMLNDPNMGALNEKNYIDFFEEIATELEKSDKTLAASFKTAIGGKPVRKVLFMCAAGAHRSPKSVSMLKQQMEQNPDFEGADITVESEAAEAVNRDYYYRVTQGIELKNVDPAKNLTEYDVVFITPDADLMLRNNLPPKEYGKYKNLKVILLPSSDKPLQYIKQREELSKRFGENKGQSPVSVTPTPKQGTLTTGGIGANMPPEPRDPLYPQDGANKPAPFSRLADNDPEKRAAIEALKNDLKNKSIPPEERLDKINRKIRELYQNKLEEFLKKGEELLKKYEELSIKLKKLQALSKEIQKVAKTRVLKGELLKIVKETLKKEGISLSDAIKNKKLLGKKFMEIVVNIQKQAHDLQNELSIIKDEIIDTQNQTRILLDKAQNLYMGLRDELPENEFLFAKKNGKLLDNMIFGTTAKVFRKHLNALGEKLPPKLLEDLSGAGILIIINEKDATGNGKYYGAGKFIILNNILANKDIAVHFDMVSFHEIFHAVKDNKAIFGRVKSTYADTVKLLRRTYGEIKKKKGILCNIIFASLETDYAQRGKKAHSDEFYEDITASLFALYYCDHIQIQSARGTKSLKETFREENAALFDLIEKMHRELSGK